jgi:hypothetical protein
MKTLISLCVALSLLGCAQYTHPYKDALAFDRDYIDCQVKAAQVQAPLVTGYQTALTSTAATVAGWNTYLSCMRGHGWTSY